MSRTSLDDRESHESHDRLLKSGDDHLNDSRGWETHLEQSSKQRIFNYVSFIAFTSLSLNILLIVSFLCLWLRTRSPLPPWPDTLYSPAQSAVEYEIVTFNSDFPEDHSGTTDFYGASLKAEDAWRNLMKPYLVRISGQEASKLSRPTSQISRDPDYYITSLDVYHQLHCLNDIRKMFFIEQASDLNLGLTDVPRLKALIQRLYHPLWNQDMSATGVELQSALTLPGSEITHVFQCWFYNPEIVFLNVSSEHAVVILPLTDFELQINMSLDMASPAIDNEKHLGSQNQDEQNLERHGYVQQTKRNFSLTAMVATCVNLMATWEALSSTLAAGLVSGGAVSLVYGVIVAFVGSLCSASSLAELASSYPTAGGQYHFVAKLSPKTSRPLTSWFAGYISTLGWIASAGSAPFLAGTQIQGLLVLNYPDSYVFQRWHGTLLFWAVLLGSACICIFCSNKLPLIEKLTLVLHVTFFIAIIVTMAVTSPTKHSAEWVFSHFENNSGWGNDAVAWSIGLLSSCYVLIGYDGATHLSEEMNNAEMGVPRAMVGCLLVNGPLGFAFLLVILFFMGDISAALATPTGFPIIEIFLHMTGSVAAATTMTAMITVMACLSTVPLLTAAARIMWAFARDQGLPFAERIASVDKRRQIPTVSIIVVSFLLMLLSLINIGSTTAFNAILSLAVVSLQASYLLPIILLIWRRLFRPDTLRWGPWRLGKAGLPINIIAVIYLIYTCIFLLFPPYQPITPVNMNYAPVVLGGALIFGCIYWPLRRNPLPIPTLRLSHILDKLLISLTSYQGLSVTLLSMGYSLRDSGSLSDDLIASLGLAALHGSVYCFFGIDPKATEIENSGHSPGSGASPSSQSDADKALILYSPQEESSKLLTHYFTSACQVLSSFDSPNNPYRSDLLKFIRNSPIVFNSALSASAAHLSQQEHDTSLIPLTFQTEAISHISRELAEINVTQNVLAPLRSTPPTIKDDLMLGIALIGMTSVGALVRNDLTRLTSGLAELA
ncbi:hypothetical protein FANTH_3378 [Fusarium anthophilum]|uniref:Uncharacterized protein n=1 Tax=Fusarium anthophilum TaxID=48485 RepID=A0A8H4ZS85_9HYPO|nr:hypothetical protein FANTH_3378 [Fusarium anthophilum]